MRHIRNDRDLSARDGLVLLGALAVMVWGLASLACGGSTQNTRDPEEEPGEGVPDEDYAQPEAPARTDVVRFAVDDGGLEMALPMTRYVQVVGQKSIPTRQIVSGSWVLGNFVFVGKQISTTLEGGLTEDVVAAMRHRRQEAEILVWTVPEDALAAERYLDMLGEDLVARIVAAPTLLDALTATPDPEASRSDLEALTFGATELGGRGALQLDFLRVHPTSRAREHIRLTLLRQRTSAGTVTFVAAVRARRDAFSDVVGDYDALLAEATFNGEPIDLSLTPSRKLGPAGDEYAIAWQATLATKAELSERVVQALLRAVSNAAGAVLQRALASPEGAGAALPSGSAQPGGSAQPDDNLPMVDEDVPNDDGTAPAATPSPGSEQKAPSDSPYRGL